MSDWTHGYVADVDYTHGYYTELSPLWARFVLLLKGVCPPAIHTACELGFGQGISVNIHAAAGAAGWHGTDFNPSQAGLARELAAASAAPAALHDQAFEEFCARPDLPDFDFIGLHGIWSWVSDANRGVIVDFVRRKLKVGGVLYLGYNAMPGWAAFAPVRHLLTRHGEASGALGAGSLPRVEAAIEFADRLLATNPLYLQVNPLLAERFKKVKEQNRQYLAHEYFNADWQPMHVGTLAEWLAPAKLGFAGSARPLDQVDMVHLTAEQSVLLRQITDPVLREDVRDFMVNQQFRCDYWIKGVRPLDALERMERLRAQRVVLIRPRAGVSLKLAIAQGQATLQESIYAPLLDLLADHRPHTMAALEQLLLDRGIGEQPFLQAVTVLAGMGVLLPAQDDAAIERARLPVSRLNLRLLHKARSSGDIAFLASPVTGGGITVGRFAQLFLLARTQGLQQPAEWAQFAWRLLDLQGQRLVIEGRTLETPEDNRRELETQAQAFAQAQLPMLEALLVA